MVKNSVDLKLKFEEANELFLSLLPDWFNIVEIESKYKEEDYKYLLNKSEYLNVEYFGDLTNETEIDLLEYVTSLK